MFSFFFSDVLERASASFCKFISANDVGKTGGHQSGYYVSKEGSKALFDCDCIKGTIEERKIKILWPDGSKTDSRFVYYGQKSRNESRITNFGRGFEFMKEDYIGSLLVISRVDSDEYVASVLSRDDEIEQFLQQYNIPITAKSYLIQNKSESASPNDKLQSLLLDVVSRYDAFPDTTVMSQFARDCYNAAFSLSNNQIFQFPDKTLKKWLDTETDLFTLLEDKIYRPIYSSPFGSLKEFSKAANAILNRRKSRAGKSLEHHLSKIFLASKLKFEEQCITEGNKKPDFIFPGGEEYHNMLFPGEDLFFLGAKTTCKDRWRQVLNEADRIDVKYLFTLQPGISSNQMKEMRDENLYLVVPEDNIKCFTKKNQQELLSLKGFIDIVKNNQEKYHFF